MGLAGDDRGDPLGVFEEGPRGGRGRVREGVGQALTETFDAREGLVLVQAKGRTDLGPVLGGHVSHLPVHPDLHRRSERLALLEVGSVGGDVVQRC